MASELGRLGLRPEVLAAAGDAFADGRWDEAVFAAFRDVEVALQARLHSTQIGSQLVEEAFDYPAPIPKVQIGDTSRRTTETLNHLFKGSLGLKGDRSHRVAPAIECRDREMCLRMLGLASLLHDLLDQDAQVAPAILGIAAVDNDTIALHVVRASPTSNVLIGSAQAEVVTRSNRTITVRMPQGVSPPLKLRLVDGLRQSRLFSVDTLPSSARDANYHEIVSVGIELFPSITEPHARGERGIEVKSVESGRAFIRFFPTTEHYAPGDYVSWDWDTAGAVGESWVVREGTRVPAFNGSMAFAGRVLGHRGTPRLLGIELRPRHAKLRPGARLPLRVIGFYEDGPVRWREDLTGQARIESDNPRVAMVIPGPSLVARGAGETTLRAHHGALFSEAPALVAAFPSGEVAEFLGGLLLPTCLGRRDDSILIANRQNHLWSLGPDLALRQLFSLPFPSTDTIGIDTFTVDPSGNVYIRRLTAGDVVRVNSGDGYASSLSVFSAPAGTGVTSVTWTHERDLVIATSDGLLWSHTTGGGFQPWARLPVAAVGMAGTRQHLWSIAGGGGPGWMRLLWDGTGVEWERSFAADLPSPSAVASNGDDVLIADFHRGAVFVVSNGQLTLIGKGFTNPNSVCLAPGGGALVANFSGDSIDRVLD